MKGKKRKKVHCELFLQNYRRYFCRFGSSFRGHIDEYSGLDIWLKGLCPKICITVLCNKGLVSQVSSTEEKENFDPPKERRAPVSFNVQNCVLSLQMLRDMLIDVGAKKLINDGQGECVTLRRACWTAWPPGSL